MFEYGSRVGFWRLLPAVPRARPADDGVRRRAGARAQSAARRAPSRPPTGTWSATAGAGSSTTCWTRRPSATISPAPTIPSRALIGRTPEGWYCRYAPSRAHPPAGGRARRLHLRQRRLRRRTAVLDDGRATAPHLVVPYSLATNDAKLVGGPLVTGRAWGEFLIDSVDGLLAEAALHPRMMSVGMHPRILGHPGRLRGLADFLDHIAAAIRASGSAAGARSPPHFRAQVPPPGSEVAA